MNKSYFCSERVRLRAMEPEDLEVMYAMENDSQTWDVTNFTVPYSRFVLKQYIENSECDMFADRQLRMMIVRAEDDALIGTIDITEFSPMHARGEVGIAIRKEYQGNGYAKEALRLLCDYVFSFLYLKQLIVHISVDNEASICLFESCGFVRCGLLREWWRVGGCYMDISYFAPSLHNAFFQSVPLAASSISELMFSLPTSQVFSSISRPSCSYSQPEYPKKNLILPLTGFPCMM